MQHYQSFTQSLKITTEISFSVVIVAPFHSQYPMSLSSQSPFNSWEQKEVHGSQIGVVWRLEHRYNTNFDLKLGENKFDMAWDVVI